MICPGEVWQDEVPTAACNHSQVHFFTSFHLCPCERVIHYPGCLYAWDGTVRSSHRDAGRADRFMRGLRVKRCCAEWFPRVPYARCRASVCGLQPAPTQTVHPAETCKKTLITSDGNLWKRTPVSCFDLQLHVCVRCCIFTPYYLVCLSVRCLDIKVKCWGIQTLANQLHLLLSETKTALPKNTPHCQRALLTDVDWLKLRSKTFRTDVF